MFQLLAVLYVTLFGFGVSCGSFPMLVMGTTGGVMFVKLLGAVRTVEFMALAGNPEQGNSHQKDRE